MKKKKNAFTLIELLAIIVILAIIAVITVPIILNIIENSRRGAATDSAYGYRDAVNKYYVTELSKNNKLMLNDTYTVNSDGSLSGGNFGDDEVQSLPISISGTVPTSGTLTYSNNTLTSGCLIIGDYAVTFADGSVSNTKKGVCPSFADDEWATIVTNLKTNRSSYPIGSEKIVEIDVDENGIPENYAVRLVNTSSCSNWNGSKTACGVVIEFKDIITMRNFNSSFSNRGGWPETTTTNPLYTYVNTTLFNKLPEELRNVIIDTFVVSGYEFKKTENYTSTDKLYLLSYVELFGSDYETDSVKTTDTKQLKFYEIHNTDNYRIKYLNGTPQTYWLRSATSNVGMTYFTVDENGNIGTMGSPGSGGVVLAFRILD